MTAAKVVDNRALPRFELELPAGTALADYRLKDGRISFTHTEVPPEAEGEGAGSRLIAGALADARERGLKVVPICSFVRHYIETHDEVQDLLD